MRVHREVILKISIVASFLSNGRWTFLYFITGRFLFYFIRKKNNISRKICLKFLSSWSVGQSLGWFVCNNSPKGKLHCHAPIIGPHLFVCILKREYVAHCSTHLHTTSIFMPRLVAKKICNFLQEPSVSVSIFLHSYR